MLSPLYFMALISATSACMKTLPGEMMEGPVCDNCSPATELTCPQGTLCDFTLLQRSKNEAKCSTYACKQGQMLALLGAQPEGISSAVCDRANQLIWKVDTGELLGRNLQATCGFPCSTCPPLTAVETPCPMNYDCSITGTAEPITYSMDTQGCAVAACASGQMFSAGQPAQNAICANGGYLINGKIVSQVACGLPCNTCPIPPRGGLTCPDGLVCTTVSKRAGQCSEAYCPSGVMTADGVQVNFLTCNGQGKWEDAAGTVYTAAQCEMSCELCAALTNAGMPCPTGLICEVTAEREGQCKESYCAKGQMTGNPSRVTLTSLTCNGLSQWVDAQNAIYTTAQCEIPCDQCMPLPSGSACPMGFVCIPVEDQPGQCPSVVCTTGTMKAQPGNVAVTSLTCDGSAQWIDAQKNVYTAAQCEASCTGCTTLSNGGMTCPKGFVCEVAATREGQCTETYCPKGQLTGNAARTPLTLLTCDANAQWVDAQAATYTTAQCELPCNQCPALTNAGMTCLSGFKCTAVLTRNDGQCPEAYCDTGLMTAGSGRTTVPLLTCNGLQQWVDPQMTAYSIAQCETSCTCPPLTITTSPNRLLPSRGNALGADAQGCSTLVSRCTRNDLYRLVTANGVVTLEPPAAQNTAMTCVDGKWMATINGVETVVQEQACYVFPCTSCNAVRTGPGVTTTLAYDSTSWCKQYTLSGCPNGYKVGTTTIGTTLTCTNLLRWSSGSFNGPIGGAVTVNCA